MGDTGYVILLAADAYDVPYRCDSDEWSERVVDPVQIFRLLSVSCKDPKVHPNAGEKTSAAHRQAAYSGLGLWASCSDL